MNNTNYKYKKINSLLKKYHLIMIILIEIQISKIS